MLWSLSGYLITACLGSTKPKSLALTRSNRASSVGIDRLVPGRVALEALLQRLDALRRQRVGAVVAVLGIDREPIFLVLQLGEEVEHALAADPGAMEST